MNSADAIAALREALSFIYVDTADYIRVNNLGDIYHNQCMRMARTALAATEHVEDIPAILFDGCTVFRHLDAKGLQRTSHENVSDVLDAVVRAIRAQGKDKGKSI